MTKHLVSINDVSSREILSLLRTADTFRLKPNGDQLKNKIVACLFFEPSTRTRLSFEAAVYRLGGQIIGFSGSDGTSQAKGETLEDTVRVVSRYCDLIVLRHPEAGSAARAAAVSRVPIINGGDGPNEHPTQTLLDLYSIQLTQGTIDGLHVAVAGDLKNSRTIHSLVKALSIFDTTFTFISAKSQKMPPEILYAIPGRFRERSVIGDLSDADLFYINRIQRERFDTAADYKKILGQLTLTLKHLKNVKENFKVLDPLPRIEEIALEVDAHPAAYYFDQAENGVYLRQALLSAMLA